MNITQKEIVRIVSIGALFTGLGLIVVELQNILRDGFNPFIVGTVILLIGAYLFDWSK